MHHRGAFVSSKKRFLTKVFLDLYVSSIKAALMSMARDHRCQRSLNVLISDFLPFRFLFVFSIGPITTGCNLCGRENSKFSSTTQVQSSLTTPRHLRSSCRRSSTPLKSRYAAQPTILPLVSWLEYPDEIICVWTWSGAVYAKTASSRSKCLLPTNSDRPLATSAFLLPQCSIAL